MTRHSLTRPALMLVIGAACARAALVPAPAALAQEARQPAYSWPGVYDLIGRGFPEGERQAVFTVARADTGYTLQVVGPPGSLVTLHIVGDSLHSVWNFGDGALMYTGLRGRGDSVTGWWRIGDAAGTIHGVRRRRE